MKKPRVKRSAVSKLKGEGLAALEEFQARLRDLPNVLGAKGQARLLDVGIEKLAVRIPDVVVELLNEAQPISVADATARAVAAGKSWQDVKATLELRVRLARARALWECAETEDAGLELTQISASASSRRVELILEATSRADPAWSPTFSLALLRSSSGSLANSLGAALSLVDAMTGSGQQPAAALVLGQVIAAWPLWPSLERGSLAERIGRLDVDHRVPLQTQLAAATPPRRE